MCQALGTTSWGKCRAIRVAILLCYTSAGNDLSPRWEKLAGFLVKSFDGPAKPFSAAMKVVDFGGCEIRDGIELGSFRAAWTYWGNSKQWHVRRDPNRALLIEGQPDRLPYAEETLEAWLDGRTGSFRGFEIRSDDVGGSRVRIFTDPLATRPVYYLAASSSICISDKLATILLNSDTEIKADWGGLLESAILGSLYSHKTSVMNAVLLPPGECVEFRGGRIAMRWKHALRPDASISEDAVKRDPAASLQVALEKSIAETWTDCDVRLLLSGGLDSRIVLALARGKRKALTLELYSEETEIAKQVAAVSQSELEVVPAPDYEYPMRWAYLVTGAMHDSHVVHHLGLVQDWRQRGIPGITHGYFHNTIYRGWTAAPYERHPFCSSVLYELMGRSAYYLERYSCKQPAFQRDFYGLLSDDGKAVLRDQLRELAGSLELVVVDGYDLTFERRLLEFVPRQTYFSVMLPWYEALDVCSPVFHPALWTWYSLSSPKQRAQDWAIREVYLKLEHPAAKLPDANTGQPITHLQPNWHDKVRNQFWYPRVRSAYLKLFWKPPLFQHGGMKWGERFHTTSALALFEDAINVLCNNPLFDRSRVRGAMEAYRKGQLDLVDSICAMTMLGQWQRLMAQPASLTEHICGVEAGPAGAKQDLAPARAVESTA
ncbi:MAG TPA: hypothetical protein VMA71_06900 [Alloacidobacterium sp.]|nr:hypothetical protein [Alloacidobacterium sp.]